MVKHDPAEMATADESDQMRRDTAIAELLRRDEILKLEALVNENAHVLRIRAAMSPYNAWACIFIDIKLVHRVLQRYMKLAILIRAVPLNAAMMDASTTLAIAQCPGPTEIQAAFFELLTQLLAALGTAMAAQLPYWWDALGLLPEDADNLANHPFWANIFLKAMNEAAQRKHLVKLSTQPGDCMTLDWGQLFIQTPVIAQLVQAAQHYLLCRLNNKLVTQEQLQTLAIPGHREGTLVSKLQVQALASSSGDPQDMASNATTSQRTEVLKLLIRAPFDAQQSEATNALLQLSRERPIGDTTVVTLCNVAAL